MAWQSPLRMAFHYYSIILACCFFVRGKRRWLQRSAGLAERSTPLTHGGLSKITAVTEQHVAGSHEPGHVSGEGPESAEQLMQHRPLRHQKMGPGDVACIE